MEKNIYKVFVKVAGLSSPVLVRAETIELAIQYSRERFFGCEIVLVSLENIEII